MLSPHRSRPPCGSEAGSLPGRPACRRCPRPWHRYPGRACPLGRRSGWRAGRQPVLGGSARTVGAVGSRSSPISTKAALNDIGAVDEEILPQGYRRQTARNSSWNVLCRQDAPGRVAQELGRAACAMREPSEISLPAEQVLRAKAGAAKIRQAFAKKPGRLLSCCNDSITRRCTLSLGLQP